MNKPLVNQKATKVHPADNVLAALANLSENDKVRYNDEEYTIIGNVPAKHKFVTDDLHPGDEVFMYGVLVGKAITFIPRGSAITITNIAHAASDYQVGQRNIDWLKPDFSKFINSTFKGFHRADGKVGTANYWLIIPMVFCENRNLDVLKEALVDELGYGSNQIRRAQVGSLVDMYRSGKSPAEVLKSDLAFSDTKSRQRLFKNVDGIKFLNHDGGCGGTRQDARALCGLLAGYIVNANVAGATIFSLGCQNAQVSILQEEIKKRDAAFSKPLFILEQQDVGSENDLISLAIKQTFAAL